MLNKIQRNSKEQLELSFKYISYKVKENGKHAYKTLLNNLNGCFTTGKLTAIMGPSGAGKTTLLNVLAGCERSASGKILLNGIEYDLQKFRKISSYIMQDSELFSLLTVMESMCIASSLKLPLDTSHGVRKNNIMEILVSLGLEECLNVRAGNLSGGQRKRLFIAQELLSNLPIIFLDEPTSGLDTVSANQCVSVLKKLSENGKMAVITIHQPSAIILEKFDHLYFLSQGKCFYQGPVTQLVPYLQTFGLNCPKYHNPADYATEISCLEYGEDVLEQLVCKISEYYVTQAEHCSQDISSNRQEPDPLFRDQFKTVINEVQVLLKRYRISAKRNSIQTYLVLLAYLFSGLSVGLVYQGRGYYADDAASFYCCLMVCGLAMVTGGVLYSIIFFPLEFQIFKREYSNSWYNLISYFLAKTLVEIPTQALCCFIFTTSVYLLSSQPLKLSRFLGQYIISFLSLLNSYVVGILIGIILGTKKGAFMGNVYVIFTGLFSGSYIPFKDTSLWVQWISYINFGRYAWQGFYAVSYYGADKLPCHEETFYCHFKYTKIIYLYFGVEQANISTCIIAMMLLLVYLK